MNSRYLVLLLAVCWVGTSKAQTIKPFSIGAYVQKVYMTGSAEDRWKDGWGAGISADIKLPGRLGITGSAGYLHAAGLPDQTEQNPTIRAWPIQAGLKFRPAPFLYFKMEAGAAKASGGSSSAFILSPGVGIRVLGIDLQGKYEQWSGDMPLRFWAIRAALHL